MTLAKAPATDAAGYRPSIDGLRAVAVLCVVAFHAFPSLLPGGYVGVDVFFVISGFLISGIILKGLDEGRFRFADFYARRIRRIFPALVLVLALCLAFGWIALLPAEYAQLGRHVAGGAGFVSNLLLWQESGYFDTSAEYKPLLHLWSLGIEEQFYIAWPLVLVAAWRLRLGAAAVIAALALGSFVLNAAMIRDHAVGTFYLPLTRAWELLAGALLAQAALGRSRSPRALARFTPPPADAMAAAGLALIGLAAATLDIRSRFPGWWALLPVAGALLVIAAGERSAVNRALLGNRAMVAVGLVSYPLYLWHWPLLSFARIMESGTPSVAIRAGAVVLALGLAALTFAWIERPLRHRRGAVVTGALVAAMLATGLAGYAIHRLNGLPERMPQRLAMLETFDWTPSRQRQKSCVERMAVPGMGYCLEPDPPQATVVLLGDSHANQYYFALADRYAARGERLLNLGGGGCLPFLDLESSEKGTTTRCADVMNRVLADTAANAAIRTVILASRGPLYTTGSGFGEVERHNRYIRDRRDPGNERYPEVFAHAMERTLALLASAGKRVVMVLDVPELGFDPRACVELRPLTLAWKPRTPCAVPREVANARNQDYRALVRSVASRFPDVTVFDPWPALCDEASCWAQKDGVMLYRNDDHLTLEGARRVMERFPDD
jgi:peptidoglycan/LPS O-acetylase OafA/YrhL